MEQNVSYPISSAELQAVKSAILRSRAYAATLVNREMLSLYYSVGAFVSFNSRNGHWGTGAIAMLSDWLQKQMPGLRGFSEGNIKKMRLFFENWAMFLGNDNDNKSALIVNRSPVANDLQVSDNSLVVNERVLLGQVQMPVLEQFDMREFLQVPFTHHLEIIAKSKDIEERLFYIHHTARNCWGKRDLQKQLKSDLFHHQGTMPNNFLQTIPDDGLAHKALCMFRDEYMLDFINLDEYNLPEEDIDERILEKEIVANIRNFILMFGKGFCFINSQYRVDVNSHESFIDLLFFNRLLKSMVVVELKAGAFKPSYVGQLNYYLSVLDDKERQDWENPSIGIILCREMDKVVVDYAIRGINNPMGVATYKTQDEIKRELTNVLPNFDDMGKLL